jgi:NADPH:quinone reductase-like Zn-dependent oxidoreductase
MCAVQAAAFADAEVIAVIREPRATDRLRALGATHVVIAEASDAPRTAGEAAGAGIDVFLDATGRVEIGMVPEWLSPRGRMLVIAGRGRADLDLWPFYVREAQLLGFVMSAMSAQELAAAAAWINATHPSRPLTVSVGRVLGFEHTAEAHAILESGRLPRMADGTVGRLVLTPSP